MTGFVKTKAELERATGEIVRRGWPLHEWNQLKNWDSTRLDWVMRDGDLLDIGCLTSMPLRIAHQIGLKGRKVGVDPGIDPSLTRESHGLEFLNGRAEALPVAAGSFDNVTCLSVIEHDVHLGQFAMELERVLRPGGRFVMTFDFWPAPKSSGLDWGQLAGLILSLGNLGLRLEELDCTLGERVIDGDYTFGCLRGSKPA